MIIISALSRSPWRLTVAVNGVPTTSGGDYVLTRDDGLVTPVFARRLWKVGANTVEIALSEALLDGIDYTLTLPHAIGTPSAKITYRQLQAPNAPLDPPAEDVEAEAYGVDTDWLNGERSPSGDLNDVRGQACLKSDLIALAIINPGEVFHRPLVGAGLPRDVNGPSDNQSSAQQRANVVAQWRTDDRVATASATSTTNEQGQTTIKGNVVDAIAARAQDITVSGG